VVCLVSLGCAKNTVDSERALGALAQDGWLIAADPADADLCLVNTCGFIAAARAETAATLRALARNRRRGRPSRIAALGCLVERTQSQPEFAELLAAADAHWTFADYPRQPRQARIIRACRGWRARCWASRRRGRMSRRRISSNGRGW